MITLYTWTTPNGRKPSILLEELGVPYRVRPVNIGKGEQFAPEFLEVSPNNKIPAIVDDEAEGGPLPLFESGAILTYLADRHGRFLAPSGPARWKALEWTFWQVGGLGPMLGVSRPSRTCAAGSTPWAPGRRCSAAWRCRRSEK